MIKLHKNRFLAFVLSFSLLNQSAVIFSIENPLQYFFQSTDDAEEYNFKKICMQVLVTFILYDIVKRIVFSKLVGDKGDEIKPAHIQGVGLKDYIGVPDKISESVEFLKNLPDYQGIEVPKGFLIVGDPGLGKTYLVKALAGELGAPLFLLDSTQLFRKYVGESVASVQKVFDAARAAGRDYAKKNNLKRGFALICIDEIGILGTRESDEISSVGRQVISKILSELDGIGEQDVDIIMFGTANDLKSIDSALLRSGRIENTINLTMPNKAHRQQHIELLLKNIWQGKLESGPVNSSQLASVTHGMTPADLKKMINDVAILSVRAKGSIEKSFFVRAVWGDFCSKYQQQFVSYESRKTDYSAVCSWDKNLSCEMFMQATEGLPKVYYNDLIKKFCTRENPQDFEQAFRNVRSSMQRKLANKAKKICNGLGYVVEQNLKKPSQVFGACSIDVPKLSWVS